MGIGDTFRKLLAQAGGDEGKDAFDRPDLRRHVVEGILERRQRGARGVDTLPATLQVTIHVSETSQGAVSRFIDDPAFDTEIEAELLNRLVGVGPEDLPLRLYAVAVGEPAGVTISEAEGGSIARIVIEGGDRGGEVDVPATVRELRLGRGPWHGDDETLANDIIVSEGDMFVSRRAAVLRRAGSALEIEATGQEECLVVIRSNGRRVRPYHTGRQRVRVEPGDAIELNDGKDQRITLVIQRPEGR